MTNELYAEARCGYFKIYELVNPCMRPIKVYCQQGITTLNINLRGCLNLGCLPQLLYIKSSVKYLKGSIFHDKSWLSRTSLCVIDTSGDAQVRKKSS